MKVPSGYKVSSKYKQKDVHVYVGIYKRVCRKKYWVRDGNWELLDKVEGKDTSTNEVSSVV